MDILRSCITNALFIWIVYMGLLIWVGLFIWGYLRCLYGLFIWVVYMGCLSRVFIWVVYLGCLSELFIWGVYLSCLSGVFIWVVYQISSNSHRPRIVAAQSEALDWNKRHPQIVAPRLVNMARLWMISDNGHHASTWTVCVVRVIPTADSRTERLCVLQTASCNYHCLIHAYLIHLSLMSLGFPKK